MKKIPPITAILLALAIGFGLFSLHMPYVSAASSLSAQIVSGDNQVIRLIPGKSFTVSVRIKNAGKALWRPSGSGFVALNTANTSLTGIVKSTIQHRFWKTWWRPTGLPKTVAPGETVDLKFAVQAPPRTIGRWTQKFSLAQAGFGFIPGGSFDVTIISFPVITFEPTPPQTIEIDQNKTASVRIEFQNTSTIGWNTKKFPLLLKTSQSAFAHSSWTNTQTPCTLPQTVIKKKGTVSCTLTLQAGDAAGSYQESYFLEAKNLGEVAKSRFLVNISVPPTASDISAPRLVAGEPMVRVGLFSQSASSTLHADDTLDIQDATGKIYGTLAPGSDAQISRSSTTAFFVTYSNQTVTVPSPVRFVPHNQTTITTITSFERRPAWNSSLNDNLFRGVIEFRMTGASTYWAVEEVAMEEYLRGIAEVSNTDNPTHLQTLITAARTYATFLVLYKTKHAAEGYDINMTTDQVYRGYNLELRSPNVTQAVLATEGKIITHPWAIDAKNPNGAIIASYSSGTDGRTRRWCEVWHCSNPSTDYPWSMSVADPLGVIPNASTLSGNHMVGLSATGARKMAEQGKTVEEILKYYYTGVEIKKIY